MTTPAPRPRKKPTRRPEVPLTGYRLAYLRERCQEYRRKSGMTVAEVCERVGMHQQSWYGIMSRTTPSLATIYRLADAMGCTVHDLLIQ